MHFALLMRWLVASGCSRWRHRVAAVVTVTAKEQHSQKLKAITLRDGD
jgi:hypothetical protein